MTVDDVRALLQRRIDEGGGTVAYARAHSVSDVYVRDVLASRRDPGPAILGALGLIKETSVSYMASGTLEAAGE